jgi:hypothetical protein
MSLMQDDWDVLEEAIEAERADVQDLMDTWYDTLSGFSAWLKEALELDETTIRQNCYHAELFLDYVIEAESKPITAINEFDLRWFFYYHAIRKMKGEDSERYLPDSLRRYIEFLRVERDFEVEDWLYDVLDAREIYEERWKEYNKLQGGDQTDWLAGYRQWVGELEDDLDSRCLLLPREVGDDLTWAEEMGWREGTFRRRAQRLWIISRNLLIEQGYSVNEMRDPLMHSYLYWLDTPQSVLEGLSPKEVILQERRERLEEAEEDI